MDLLAHPAPAVAKPSGVYAPTLLTVAIEQLVSPVMIRDFVGHPFIRPGLDFARQPHEKFCSMRVISGCGAPQAEISPWCTGGGHWSFFGQGGCAAVWRDSRRIPWNLEPMVAEHNLANGWEVLAAGGGAGRCDLPTSNSGAHSTFLHGFQGASVCFSLFLKGGKSTLDGHICNERHITVRLNLRKAFLIWLLSVISTLHFAAVWRWRARSVARSVVASVDNCWRRCRVLMVRVYGLVGAGVELRLEPAPPERVSARFAAQVSMEKPHPRHGVARPAP